MWVSSRKLKILLPSIKLPSLILTAMTIFRATHESAFGLFISRLLCLIHPSSELASQLAMYRLPQCKGPKAPLKTPLFVFSTAVLCSDCWTNSVSQKEKAFLEGKRNHVISFSFFFPNLQGYLFFALKLKWRADLIMPFLVSLRKWKHLRNSSARAPCMTKMTLHPSLWLGMFSSFCLLPQVITLHFPSLLGGGILSSHFKSVLWPARSVQFTGQTGALPWASVSFLAQRLCKGTQTRCLKCRIVWYVSIIIKEIMTSTKLSSACLRWSFASYFLGDKAFCTMCHFVFILNAQVLDISQPVTFKWDHRLRTKNAFTSKIGFKHAS